MIFLEQSAARTLALGPFVDQTNGYEAETGLTITVADVLLSKNGAAFAAKNDATDPAHLSNGFYSVVLNATDTATLGHLVISIHESGALPVWIHCHVLLPMVYGSLLSNSDLLHVDVMSVSGDSNAAINLEADYDGSGYAKPASTIGTVTTLTTANPTLDDIADAVWDEDIVAAHNTGDTAGALLDDLATPANFMADVTPLATPSNFMANVTNLDAAITTRATPTQVGTEVDNSLADIDLDHLIQVTAGAEEPTDGSYLDQIMHKDAGQTFDPTTDSLEALRENQGGATAAAIADAVWLETLADHSGSSGSAAEALAGASAPSAATVADAVWDEDIADHDGVGSTGEALASAGSGADAAAIADAVWDEDIVAAHNTGDTAGALLDDLATPANFKADVTPLATPSNFMANVSALALSSEIAALENASLDDIADAVWDEDIVAAHNTGDTAGALLDDLGTPADFKADVTPLATPSNFMANVTNLDAAISTRATPTQVGTEVDNSLADIDLDHLIQVTAGAEEPTDGSYLDQIMHKDAGQTFDPTTDSLEALRENQGGATAAAIADAVWLETLGDHSGSSGSTAEALAGASAPSAEDVADAVWDEDIVAAHNTGDTAGALLDDLGTPADFKATVSALATSAEIAALENASLSDIADAVWDEDIVAAHNTGDTAAALLDDLGTPADFKADVSALATAAAVAALNDPTADAIADAVWDEATADHQDTGSTGKALTTGGAGAGAITFVYTLTSTAGGNPPIADADIWVTTDVDGDVTVASGRTDAQGKVTFYLDAATYYFWRQKTGWDFTNPYTEVVS